MIHIVKQTHSKTLTGEAKHRVGGKGNSTAEGYFFCLLVTFNETKPSIRGKHYLPVLYGGWAYWRYAKEREAHHGKCNI